MEKNNRYFEVSKAKIYQKDYRPSSNILRLLRSVLSVLLVGGSPISSHPSHNIKRMK